MPRKSNSNDQAFLDALLERGKKLYEITFTRAQEDVLVQHIRRDFEDSFGAMNVYRRHMIEMNENWRGSTEDKDFPFEDCANIRTPLTPTFIEQMKARLIKALFGGEYIAEFSSLDKVFDKEDIKDFNDWFQFELLEIVKLKPVLRDVMHSTLVYGNAFPMAYYEHTTGELRTFKRYDLPEDGSPEEIVTQYVQQLVEEMPGASIEESPSYGVYKIKDADGDLGQIKFSAKIRDGVPELIAEIVRREVTFDGVRVYNPNIEDYCVIPSAGTVEDVPFWGNRLWLSPEDFRQGIVDGIYIDLGKDETTRICAGADIKSEEFIAQEETKLQDQERGTDQRDVSGYTPERKWIEVYRWESWWRLTDKASNDQERYLEPKVQFAVWMAVRARRIIKIARLEELNKDGKRSPVHFGFIHEPNRLLDLGLAEWLRHVQAELDAIHNQRLDAGLLTNIPWGFYKPQAGFNREILSVQPGKFLPVADPSAVSMPRNSWQPTWSFQEEGLVRRYANEQGGMNDPAIGQFTSKRQSASEFVGTSSSIDLRTGEILEYIMESFRELVYRILGLYQQFAPKKRIFQIASETGLMINKQFDIDKLQGRIFLRLTANLQQSNQELQQKIALDMLQILMNQIFIQLGVVRPDTIYAALKKISRSMGYEGVPFYKPDMPPMSDTPQEEHRQMSIGQKPTGPTMNENFEEHLHAHSQFASRPDIEQLMSPEAMQMLAEHIQMTTQMQAQAQVIKQMQAMQAMQAQKTMIAKGINPGMMGGGQPGDQTGAGTPEEGVQEAA